MTYDPTSDRLMQINDAVIMDKKKFNITINKRVWCKEKAGLTMMVARFVDVTIGRIFLDEGQHVLHFTHGIDVFVGLQIADTESYTREHVNKARQTGVAAEYVFLGSFMGSLRGARDLEIVIQERCRTFKETVDEIKAIEDKMSKGEF